MHPLIYVCDYDFLKSKMDQNAYNRVTALVNSDNVILLNVKRGDSINALEVEKKYNPCMILQEHIQPGFPVMLYNLDKVKCKTAMILGDLHSNYGLLKQVQPWKTILLYYDAGLYLKQYFPKKDFRILPHHISFDVYKDYGLEKEYDILLYGNTNSKFYPFRKRLHKLLSKHFNCKVVSYPEIRGVELAKLLNKSWMAVATKSTEDYLVAKYLEIPACNCLPIGNIATTEKSLFKEIVFEIPESMTDEMIVNKVRAALDDKPMLSSWIQENKDRIQDFSTDMWVKKVWSIANGA